MQYAEYRRRPVASSTVEAVQFVIADGQSPREAFASIIKLTAGKTRMEVLEDGTEILTVHHSGDYWLDIDPGTYLIREGGRYFPVPQKAFERIYEPTIKPKRVRRTRAQIAADNAKEAAK